MSRGSLVAVVDDDESVRETTKDLLESAGFSAVTFAGADVLLQSRHVSRLSCLIADMRMPGMTGLELRQQLLAANHAIPTILMSAYLDEGLRARALQAGVVCCLSKPFSPEELLACVHRAVRRRSGER